MNFDKLIACFDADWDESKHPRAKNGQFGKGNGGSSAPAKKEKKSTMSKSYKALSSGQKADAKANVASQIKSMSKEKQISVANRVLKAQGKEPIVVNKDGTYTWTNKGERVTTQKPPRIKSDKLARAIVSNGYDVPGIKTGVSAETAKASVKAPSLKNPPKDGGGQTSTKLSKADQTKLAKRMSSAAQDVIESQLQTYPDKDKNQVRNLYSYAGNLIEDRLKSGKFNSMNEVLKDIEKSKSNSDYQAAKKVAGRAAYMGLIPKGSSKEGGITSEQLSAAGRLASKMNGDSNKPAYLTKKFDTLERQRLVDYKLDKIGDTYMVNSYIQGVTLPYTDVQRTIKYLKAMFESGAKSFEEAIKGLPTHKDGLLNKRHFTYEKIAKGIASCLPKDK